MLEWMHDKEVVKNMHTNFTDMQIKDCLDFIKNSHTDKNNLHLAAVDENDKYLGTVSLKHINSKDKISEFAITIRKCVMGTGIAAKAMKDILQIGIQEKKLNNIFWCVNKENTRAIRFYNKNGYQITNNVPIYIKDNYNKALLQELIWYVYKGDINNVKSGSKEGIAQKQDC